MASALQEFRERRNVRILTFSIIQPRKSLEVEPKLATTLFSQLSKCGCLADFWTKNMRCFRRVGRHRFVNELQNPVKIERTARCFGRIPLPTDWDEQMRHIFSRKLGTEVNCNWHCMYFELCNWHEQRPTFFIMGHYCLLLSRTGHHFGAKWEGNDGLGLKGCTTLYHLIDGDCMGSHAEELKSFRYGFVFVCDPPCYVQNSMPWSIVLCTWVFAFLILAVFNAGSTRKQ